MKHIRTLVQTPRLLVVKLRAPGLTTTIAVAHAPHSFASDDSCATWWEDFDNHTKEYRIDHIMIDANGTAGHGTSGSFGHRPSGSFGLVRP